MTQTGSTLSFPFRADAGGNLATVRTPAETAREAIIDIIETPPRSRVMMPTYGVRDFAFAAVTGGFGRRLAYQLRSQILDYVPDVEAVEVEVEIGEANELEINVSFTLRGAASHGLVYPLWQLRRAAG